jgi:hypothetical protein
VDTVESDVTMEREVDNKALSKLSVKRSNNVEAFLKLAYQFGNQIDALHGILTNETARLKLLEFLREDYYYGAAEYFEEAQGFLEYETGIVTNQTVSQRLGIKQVTGNKHSASNATSLVTAGATGGNDKNTMSVSIKKRTQADQDTIRSGWTEEQRVRYKEVIIEISTVAFKRFLKSKMYTNFRSYEKGALSSLRAKTSILSTKESMFGNMFGATSSNRQPYTGRSNGTESTNTGTVVHSIDGSSSRPANTNSSKKSLSSSRKLFSMFSGKNKPDKAAPKLNAKMKSFTERAFAQVEVNSDERVLLCSSTWLALLVSGIESCPIGFCIISANSYTHVHSGKSMQSHSNLMSHSNLHLVAHNNTDFKISAVNGMFEYVFGRDRKDLVGSSYKILTNDPFTHFNNHHGNVVHHSPLNASHTHHAHHANNNNNNNNNGTNAANGDDQPPPRGQPPHHTTIPTSLHSREQNMQDYHNAIAKGESLITDIVVVRSNLKHLHCMVALQPVYDQHNQYRSA